MTVLVNICLRYEIFALILADISFGWGWNHKPPIELDTRPAIPSMSYAPES